MLDFIEGLKRAMSDTKLIGIITHNCDLGSLQVPDFAEEKVVDSRCYLNGVYNSKAYFGSCKYLISLRVILGVL